MKRRLSTSLGRAHGSTSGSGTIQTDRCAMHGRHDVITTCDQRSDDLPPERAGRTGDQNAHGQDAASRCWRRVRRKVLTKMKISIATANQLAYFAITFTRSFAGSPMLNPRYIHTAR